MKQFLITVAGVLVGLILFVIVVPVLLIGSLAGSADRAPVVAANSVLSIDLREELVDQPTASPFGLGSVSVIEIVRRLDAAADDKRIKGILIRANTSGMPAAHAEEIRDAIASFRKSGKFVIAHLQNEGISTSISGYSAIAGADEVWAQPNEHILPMGAGIEGVFFGGTLQKFKAQAQIEQREEFKGGDEFTNRQWSAPFRENTQQALNSWMDSFYAAVAADRELSVEQVRAFVASTPVSVDAAKAAKIVDQLGYPEDAEKAALERAGEDAELIDIADFRPTPSSDNVIALVVGDGAIMAGPEESSFFGDGGGMNSDRIAEAIDDAAKDEDAKVILFRVNSPGGTITGSDQILAAVKRAQASGKKVVVSMGPMATSGGYFVSASADEIVASAGTLTGSIGIYGGKIVFGETLREYAGVTTDSIQAGSPLSDWFSASRPFSPAEQAAFSRIIDEGYASFLRVVAEGRDLTPEQARAVAGGRLWTGAQAKEVGLVDHVGGFSVALDRAKALAGLKPEDEIALRIYPEARSPIEELQAAFGVSAQAATGAAALAAVLGDERVAAALRTALDERQPAARAETQLLEIR